MLEACISIRTIFFFNSVTPIRGDILHGESDLSSTSSQASSEHDPLLRTQIQTCNMSPLRICSDDSANLYTSNNHSNTNYKNNNFTLSPSTNNKSSLSNVLNPSKDVQSSETVINHTVKIFDQLPEYKLFASNGPSIHSILLGKNESNQQSQRPSTNGIDHNLREIEKRFMGILIILFY